MSRILIVEDNEENRDVLARRLRRRGFEVIVAADGRAGVKAASEGAPDVILMDINMPDVDGWEAIRQIKALPQVAGIPIMALSAHAMAGDRERALAAGCIDYHTKPVEFDTLLEQIDEILGGAAD